MFPVNEERRNLWIRAISRDRWQPKAHDRICGKHFVSGRPSKDPSSIDYVPSVFSDGKIRSNVPKFDANREFRRSKRAVAKEEQAAIEKHDEMEAESAAAVLLNMSVLSAATQPMIRDVSTQTDLFDDTSLLLLKEMLADNQKLLSTIISQKIQLDQAKLKSTSPLVLINNDSKTKFYTGLPSRAVFILLCNYLQTFVDGPNDGSRMKKKLSAEEEFLSVLMRLRLGLLVEDVADRFGVSCSTYSRIFVTWIQVLAVNLKKIFPWPSKELVASHTPAAFKKYPNTRVIIDCTEFFIQRPTSLHSQSLTFSHYKHHNTFKVLIGISPGGVITFVSELWGGRISDKALTESSGLLDLLEAGDNVMADRGFDISSLLQQKQVTLNIPPFLGDRKQLTSTEVLETRRIATLRIHVERAIGRMKNYRLLQYTIPLTLADIASDLVCVCAYLTNFCNPVINND